VFLPSWRHVSSRLHLHLSSNPPKPLTGLGEDPLLVLERTWRAVQGVLLDAAAWCIDTGGGKHRSTEPPRPTFPPGERECLEALDEAPEPVRLVALHRWVDKLAYSEIALALRSGFSLEHDPREIGEMLLEARDRVARSRPGVEARIPMGEPSCGMEVVLVGRLADAESILDRHKRRVRNHLPICEHCTSVLATIRETDRWAQFLLRKHCTAHPTLSDLLMRSEEALPATRAALLDRHLVLCGRCQQLYAILGRMVEMDPESLLRAAGRLRLPMRTVLLLGVLAAVAAVGVGVHKWGRWRDETRVRRFYGTIESTLSPLSYETGLWPLAGLPREEDPLWRAGIGAYREERCGAAAGQFRKYAAARADDPVGRLFLGASLLCDGRPAEAVPPLEAAAEGATPVWEESTWLLAHAHLALGDSDRAREVLEELSTRGVSYREAAEMRLRTML
jgi:hypothetical protein